MRVSPLSVFEVSALHGSGRLRLSRSLEQWLDAAIDGAGIRLAPLSREASVEAGLLSRDAIPDPLDRLLVATAHQSEATFVTADRRILDYAASSRALRAHDARR
jgi:PIN domain nuclease of toxin-antitoxin system